MNIEIIKLIDNLPNIKDDWRTIAIRDDFGNVSIVLTPDEMDAIVKLRQLLDKEIK